MPFYALPPCRYAVMRCLQRGYANPVTFIRGSLTRWGASSARLHEVQTYAQRANALGPGGSSLGANIAGCPAGRGCLGPGGNPLGAGVARDCLGPGGSPLGAGVARLSGAWRESAGGRGRTLASYRGRAGATLIAVDLQLPCALAFGGRVTSTVDSSS